MRRVLLLLAAAAALGGGVAIFWYMGVRSAEAGFREWADALGATGYDVVLGDITVSGFPNPTDAIIDGVEIARPTDSFAWRWTAPRVLVTGRVDGDRIELRLLGTQTLSYLAAGDERSARFGSQRFLLSLERGATGRIGQITVEIAGFVLRRQDGGDPVTARRLQARLALAAGDGAVPDNSTAALKIEGLVLPAQRLGPLGSTIESFSADVTFQRGLPSLDLAVEVPAWQVAPDGRLMVAQSQLHWGLLNLEADGIVELDEQYRPKGRLASRIQDFVPALDAFYATGRVDGVQRADYYATLLPGIGNSDSRTIDVEVLFEDGNILLRHDERGLGALTVGSLSPILPLAHTIGR